MLSFGFMDSKLYTHLEQLRNFRRFRKGIARFLEFKKPSMVLSESGVGAVQNICLQGPNTHGTPLKYGTPSWPLVAKQLASKGVPERPTVTYHTMFYTPSNAIM